MSNDNNNKNGNSFEDMINVFAKGMQVTELNDKLNNEADRLELEQNHIRAALYNHKQETNKIKRRSKNVEKTGAQLEEERQKLINSDETTQQDVESYKKRFDRYIKRMESVNQDYKTQEVKLNEINKRIDKFEKDQSKLLTEFRKLGVAHEKFAEIVPDWVKDFSAKLMKSDKK